MEDMLRVDPETEHEQVERLKAFKGSATRSSPSAGWRSCAAPPRGSENLLPFIRQALKDRVLDGRGLRRDARRVRRVPAGHLGAGPQTLNHPQRGLTLNLPP